MLIINTKPILFLVAVLFAVGVDNSPIKTNNIHQQVCGTCPTTDPNRINVHLIPHSHDDVGWLKTVDQYYYGLRRNIQEAGVQFIITSVVEALKKDSNRKFVQVETAFFYKWWQDQSEELRADFRKLVENGQIEMINGAWAMNDEACANYQSTIDQFSWGLRKINETVGPCGTPQIGWQIDPFGHSREQASIFAQLGFDGVFFARLDNKDRETRKASKNMDFLWKGSANIDDSVIFGNAFPESLYYPPSGFCFDVTCGDDAIDDDPESFDYNVITKASDFSDKMKQYATYYPTNNVLVPMGGDFQYQAAEFNFVNMDRLLKYFANNTELNVFYSSPSCYIKSVNEAKPELKQKIDDFFPYGSDDHSYWGGYFTSRPNSKRFERTSHNILQSAKQLSVINNVINGGYDDENLRLLREVMGIMQHHDAITGTEKQHVVQDYVRLLHRAVKRTEEPIGAIIGNLLKKGDKAAGNLELSSCLLSNISICEPTSQDNFVVAVYNPLSRPVSYYVQIPVSNPGLAHFTVTGIDGQLADDDVVTTYPIRSFKYVDYEQEPLPYLLNFPAKDVPALGLNLYKVVVTPNTDSSKQVRDDDIWHFGTDELGFSLDPDTYKLKTVTSNGITLEITQDLMYYEGANGDNSGDNKASGAYIFRPLNGNETARPLADIANIMTQNSTLLDEAKLYFNNFSQQIIRVYKGEDNDHNYIEFDWIVGPIDVDNDNGIGKEIISRFTVKDFKNNGVFYTDSNGRELIKRTKDKRYDYDYDPTLEPIASNYYPVTSKIVIEDEAKGIRVAVLNDHAQGGTSLDDGQLELMVHRRLLKDDAKGVDEALNETEFNQGVVVRGKHYLIIGPSGSQTNNSGKSTAAQEREVALRTLLAPWVLVGNPDEDTLNNLNLQFTTLAKTIPDNVNILTLEPWTLADDGTIQYLLRLEHILEQNEDDNLSKDVTVDLDGLFKSFDIQSMVETTLGGNQLLEEYNKKEKYEWNVQGGGTVHRNVAVPADGLQVTLKPMQIRTFLVTLSKN